MEEHSLVHPHAFQSLVVRQLELNSPFDNYPPKYEGTVTFYLTSRI